MDTLEYRLGIKTQSVTAILSDLRDRPLAPLRSVDFRPMPQQQGEPEHYHLHF
ncbi:MAG: hypothetical protein VKJ09_00990 [Leptolyngbya sp.]|nr:hypothetical protein [Leptolyngbya sp.]